MRDRGAMLVTVLLVSVAVIAALTMALVPVLGDLSDRQRARSAADSAALAGVTGGRAAAAAMSARNDASLTGWSRSGRTVTVWVQVGDQVVVARATDEP